MEITPIGIQNIGWKFWIVWTVTNLSFLPVLYFLYPETGESVKLKSSYSDINGSVSQQTEASKILMLITVPIRRLLSLETRTPSARDGRRSTSIVRMRRLNEQQLVKGFRPGRLNTLRLLDIRKLIKSSLYYCNISMTLSRLER